LCPQ